MGYSVKFLILLCFVSQFGYAKSVTEEDIKYFSGKWSCEGTTRYGGLVIEVRDLAEVDLSLSKSFSKTTTTSYYEDRPEIKSVLYTETDYQMDVENNIATVLGEIVKIEVLEDELNQLTPKFLKYLRENREPASVGNGTMIALEAKSRKQVDLLHEKALSLGAVDEGTPGKRSGGYYCAYFRDLDGNKLNFHVRPDVI